MRVAPVLYSVKDTQRSLPLTFQGQQDPISLSQRLAEAVAAGVQVLQRGGVVAFPTDTLYGLGADFASSDAVQRVLAIKGRPQHMGVPLLLADANQLAQVAGKLPERAWVLARRFWPGALTLVVPRSAAVSDPVTGGRSTVAVRVPDHPVPRALAWGLGRPITGTSANRTGHPVPATAGEVRQQLGDTLDMVIDGGPSPLGRASTILDVSGSVLRILRLGAVSVEQIRLACPGAKVEDNSPVSTGVPGS
ncbi:MAG: threonylcarbamoyl-AMP synthase [Chloroflexi bacterium]|nr:threonylcarbamoyl-AMP synthase [Chloroflexota bacterium]